MNKEPIYFAPLNRGEVVAELYNHLPDIGKRISAEEAEQLICRELGHAKTLNGQQMPRENGLLQTLNGHYLGVELSEGSKICAAAYPNEDADAIIRHLKTKKEVQIDPAAIAVARKFMEKIISCVIIAFMSVSLCFANTRQIEIVTGMEGMRLYQLPAVETYNRTYVQGSSYYDILVVPSVVTNISIMAFVGSPYGSYQYYDWIALKGSRNLLFMGDVPSCFDDSGSIMIAEYSYNGRPFYSRREQFYQCTCWYIEGNVGWRNGNTWLGGTTKPGAAKVELSPSSSNGYERYYYSTTSQDVTINCTNSSATIYYTLDGTQPTTNSAVYSAPIEINGRTTLRACAMVDGYPFTIIETCSYGKGEVGNPIIDGLCDFDHANNRVELSDEIDGATIRYTLDGTPVTEQSPIYTEPFAISDTTVVRAKAFKQDWFDSEEVTQTFTRLWYTNETPAVSADAETFAAASQEVTLSCGTEGATIYYTLDGSEPSAASGRIYKAPFRIYQTTTVKAIAVKDDWKDSAIACATFTKANGIGPAINLLEALPDNDKTHPWEVVADVTHDGVSAVKSGAIEDDETTALKVVLYGAGRLSFWWKTCCEPSIDGEWYDYATFWDGATAVTNLAGASGWRKVTREVAGTGKHTFKWTYAKDGSGSTVPDGVWLDQVQWLPQTDDWYAGHTLTTETPVPYAWLDRFGLGRESDFETAAKSKSGKRDGAGRELTVEEEYVAGTNPTNAADVFTATIEMADGAPRIRWTPDLNTNGEERAYTIYGKESLDDAKWETHTNSAHRFFKVSVGMP